MIQSFAFKKAGVSGWLPALVAALALGACGNKEQVVQPQQKPLIEGVYASGYVVAKDEYEVYAQTEGYLVDKLVKDGDEVKQGDPMFVIDAGQQDARYRIARENYEIADRNYNPDGPVLVELKAAVETARSKMEFDSVNHVRYNNLLERNAIARSEYDRMKLVYENSLNEYILQKSRYAKMRDQLYLELTNAKNQLIISGDESKRHIIRSEVDGMIFKTIKEQGEMIRRGEVIAVAGQKDSFYLTLSVDELDILRVKEGQKVLIRINAYPEKVFNARISHVFPMIDRQQQSVRVDADLEETLPGWFSGLALEANIIIRQKENAMVISKSVLLPGDSVLIKTDGGTRKVKVVRGIDTLDEVEILEGLDTTSRLIVRQ